MRGRVCGIWAISSAIGPDSSSPTTTNALTSDSTMISAATIARQADAEQLPHHRLEHRAEHEGQHDRQDDLGRHIAGGEQRQQQQAAEEYRPEFGRAFRPAGFYVDLDRRRRAVRHVRLVPPAVPPRAASA